MRGDDDVRGPAGTGEQRESDAGPAERGGAEAEQHDAGATEKGPDDLPYSPARDQRNRERAEELERHREPDRDPAERLVDAPVHPRESDRVAGDQEPVVARTAAQLRPGPQQQDDGRRGEPEPHDARRARETEKVLGDRGADLDRGDAAEDEPDGARPHQAWPAPRTHAVHLMGTLHLMGTARMVSSVPHPSVGALYPDGCREPRAARPG